MEKVSVQKAIFRFKNIKQSQLQSDKVTLGIESKLTDMCDPLNLNRLKEHEANAISFAHVQRDDSSIMQLVQVF